MARKRSHSRKRRKKRVSGPKVIGRRRKRRSVSAAPRKRRRHHARVSGPRRRRRIGAVSSADLGNFTAELLGIGTGMVATNIATTVMQGQTGAWSPAAMGFSAAIKIGGGFGIYHVGKQHGFVRGFGLGVAGSGVNDGLSLIPGVRISGPATIIIKDGNSGQKYNNLRQLPQGTMNGVKVLQGPGMQSYNDDDQYNLTGTY